MTDDGKNEAIRSMRSTIKQQRLTIEGLKQELAAKDASSAAALEGRVALGIRIGNLEQKWKDIAAILETFLRKVTG